MSGVVTGVWVTPEVADGSELRWHAVVDIQDGSVLLACRGRVAVSAIAAIDTSPAASDRCVRCELDREPTTRVRISFGFDTSDTETP